MIKPSIFRDMLVPGLVLTLGVAGGCSTGGPRNSDLPSHHKYQKSGARTHKVVKGDTLYAISWKAGVDYKTLARWNGLRPPYRIYPGQVLRLKPPAKKQASTKTQGSRKSKSKKSATLTPTRAARQKKRSGSTKSKAGGSSVALHWRWPTAGRLASTFRAGDPSRTGIKISGKKNQKILAAESGEVVYVGGGLIGYGQLIIIKHNNKYLSAYGHNSRLLVKEGEVVKRGQHIANMGLANSGRAMLHFEIRQYGKPINPSGLLPGR